MSKAKRANITEPNDDDDFEAVNNPTEFVKDKTTTRDSPYHQKLNKIEKLIDYYMERTFSSEIWTEIGKNAENYADRFFVSEWYDALRPVQPLSGSNTLSLLCDGIDNAYNLQFDYGYWIIDCWKATENRLKVNSNIEHIVIIDTLKFRERLKYDLLLSRTTIYSERKDKSENAPTFLKRVYADELAAETITLSELATIDSKLARGLRNWAHNGGHDLAQIIDPGEDNRGAPRKDLGVDASTLDPSDPKDALALSALRKREQDRNGAKRRYGARKLNPS